MAQANEKKSVDNGIIARILTVLLWIVAICYIVKAASGLLMIVRGISWLGWPGRGVFVAACILSGLLTIISCALLAYGSILSASFWKYEEDLMPDRNRNQFLIIVETSVLRIIIAFVCLALSYTARTYMPIDFSLITSQDVIKTIVFAVVFDGIVFLLLMAEGKNPFEGTTPMGFVDLNKGVFAQIVSDTQEMMNRREAKKQKTADGNIEEAGFKGLKTNRGLFKFIIFTILTFGIYGLIFYYEIAKDINTICDGDGEHTSGLLALIGFTIITCGIYSYIWEYKFADRLADNAPRYGLKFKETGTTVLLWRLVGILLCGIGPLIAMHIQIKNLNKLAAAYNKQHENDPLSANEV